jgi:argininosuccinate lyase
VHLSRLAEDVILWAGAEFNFIKIADAYTTGSSLMPQKKNPDIAELARGKTGRVFGNLMALLTLLKGLPMTYNRDLQEDKERLFDTADTVRATTRLMAAMLRNTKSIKAACAAAASDPALLATDLADYLVKKGNAVPAGASRRRRGRGAGGKNRQTAEPTDARGIAIRGQRPLAATRWACSI